MIARYSRCMWKTSPVSLCTSRSITTTRPNVPPVSAARPTTQAQQAAAIKASQRSKFSAYLALTRFHAPVGTLYHVDAWQTGKMLILFATGAFVMRSAGCVVNDLWDSDLDRRVARTATRPIASGEISRNEGVVFLGGLLSVGLGVLTQLNAYSIILGASSMVLVIVYPLMKRVTYLPQLVLGLAFNWGALLGYPALVGAQDWTAVLPLYTSGIFWTLVYDTIYAHQDVKDDVKVGIKSTALLFGDSTKSILSMLAVGQFSCLAYLGSMENLGLGFWLGSGMSAAYTANMLYKVDIKNVADCGAWFRKSQYIGWLILAGLGAEYTRQLYNEKKTEGQKARVSIIEI